MEALITSYHLSLCAKASVSCRHKLTTSLVILQGTVEATQRKVCLSKCHGCFEQKTSNNQKGYKRRVTSATGVCYSCCNAWHSRLVSVLPLPLLWQLTETVFFLSGSLQRPEPHSSQPHPGDHFGR